MAVYISSGRRMRRTIVATAGSLMNLTINLEKLP